MTGTRSMTSGRKKRPVAPMQPQLPDGLAPLTEPPEDLKAGELHEGILSNLDLSGRDASSIRLADVRMENVDLSTSVLRGASLADLFVNGGSWANADLSDAVLKRIEMRSVRLTGVSLVRARITDATFVDCRIDMSSIRSAELERVRFEGCRLGEADFYEAKLTSVVFSDCDLARASLAKASFATCEMHGCELEGVGDPERLRGVGMPWQDVLRSAGVLAAAAGIRIVDSD